MESSLKAWIGALERTASIQRQPSRTFPTVIESLAQQRGTATALISLNSTLTYTQLSASANRIARWGLTQGLAKGDVVCLLMPNRPEFVAIWIGLTRIGAVVALLNTNLSGSALAHCIRVAAPRITITDAALENSLASAASQLPTKIETWSFGPGLQNHSRLDENYTKLSSDPLAPEECLLPRLEDLALYIYTSGTTGFPKAARVSHFRIMQWTHWFAGMMRVTSDDRMYNCLPLYHSVGGVVAVGATLVGGGAVILRERFSTSEFWNDVVGESCTLFQYIGELCRYLLASPPIALESQHHLRLCCGNGLRAEVWAPFQERFRIPNILEYYASTEGNFSLYNCEGRIGSVGRIPSFLAHRLPIALVRFDVDSELPFRNVDGHCMRCSSGEIGEALGQINDSNEQSAGRFEGYADGAATELKILRDVFERGDSWYRTGDLMRQDADGFYYFADRIGDTFRWKGENVSTTEVAATVLSCDGIIDAAVYGVRVPGNDGRAGMTAIKVNEGFGLGTLQAHLKTALPDYARPVFIRIVSNIDLTGTLKLNKQLLERQAFDPNLSQDPLYYADRDLGTFLRISSAVFAELQSGVKRL
jgi:fatty-acyl-CoA synthase